VNAFIGVLVGALVLAVLAVLVVAFAAARSLVVGRLAAPIRYKRVDTDTDIEFDATDLTRAVGSYGLLLADGTHARINAVVDEDATSVRRALGPVTGRELPPRGEGRWVRDVYPSPAELGVPFTDVAVTTAGGVSPAWLIPGAGDDAVWAIHLHGIRTTRSVVLPSVSALLPTGTTSLVPSWRGDSEGPSRVGGGSSLGQEEWRDVDAALDLAVASGARSFVLVGWSMGAMISSLLMQNSRHADRVVGVVMVAPVTSWRTVLTHAVRAARLPAIVGALVEGILRTPGLCRIAGLAAPVRLSALDGAAARVAVPTLVIHNPGDPTAPFAATVDFVEQNREYAELVVFEEAPHAMEWNREPRRFEETITNWVAEVVARNRAAAGEEERP
jgi:pimeloyl-ACP methyl ester carboxylesterase